MKPDVNSLTLYSDGKEVGVCQFDITWMLDQKSEKKRLIIRPQGYVTRDDKEFVFKGNNVDFPSAFIEFSVKVRSLNAESDTRSSLMHKMSSGSVSARHSGMPIDDSAK